MALVRIVSFFALSAWALVGMCLPAADAAPQPVEIAVGYIRLDEPRLTLSLLDLPADDDGIAGARLGLADNNTTGRFTGQTFTLEDRAVSDRDSAVAALRELEERGVGWVIADLPAELLLPVAEAAAERGTLIFNIGATDDRLRIEECRANLVHVTPSRAMLADALAQYLVWKKWSRWFLVFGSHPQDAAFAEAVRRAAKRFGATIVEERLFEDTGGARRTDSGHVQVQRQLPLFTRSAPRHDVVVVADENEVFGSYMPYRTWDPRPVVGTAGLMPTVWSPAHEQWGAVQLQNRFMEQFGRLMTANDMEGWMAVRMVGEAATRAGTDEIGAITEYLLGDSFELAAFKGQKLTLREWNRQLRQPILLADGRTVVSVSPQEGFLHPASYLDTLGFDRSESRCALN